MPWQGRQKSGDGTYIYIGCLYVRLRTRSVFPCGISIYNLANLAHTCLFSCVTDTSSLLYCYVTVFYD